MGAVQFGGFGICCQIYIVVHVSLKPPRCALKCILTVVTKRKKKHTKAVISNPVLYKYEHEQPVMG